MYIKGSPISYNQKQVDASMEKGKVLWRVLLKRKWNLALQAVKSQFEVVDVLPDQQEPTKSFFEGKQMRSMLSCNNNTISQPRH